MGSTLPPRPFLYPILDGSLVGGRGVAECVASLARGGARIVQFRAKGVADRELLQGAREAVAAARAAGCLLIVNDRPDVARIVGADGVHLGQEDLAPRDVRPLLPTGAIVGLSTHSLAQVEASLSEPVDYVAVGPVFPTRTKERPDPVVGTELVRAARRLTGRPLVAIGGITEGNAAETVAAGADGIAVISALLRAPDLSAATRSFLAVLGKTA